MITFHSIFTLVSLLVFLGIVALVYSRGQKKTMEEASRIPLLDELPATETGATRAAKSSQDA
ncbi:MAG: cbb3-type cytochrome oxidase subunit 3 [Burkholderiaceae bacterium]|jgi:cbb3-type cytochrome oxidase subunit 3